METPPLTRDRARDLRKRMDLPEVLLWAQLRRRRLDGLRFRRQQPVGPYILDFYCDAAKLAVEIDGYSHGVAGRPDHDARRDRWLSDKGVMTLRIPAREVLKSMDDVLSTILATANTRPLSQLR